MNKSTHNGRNRLSGRRLSAALSTMAIAAAGAGLAPSASATLVSEFPVPADHNITVFHNIDFVATFGWDLGENLKIEVLRNDVVIGSAEAPAVATAEGNGLEVNHGPEAAAVDGDCWEGHTPDIRPGDTVRVTHASGVSEVVVDRISFTGTAVEDANSDILMRGVAKFADGTNIPIAQLDSAEFRDGKFRGIPNAVEQDPSVDGGFVLRYTAPYDLVEGRNADGLNEAQRKASLLNSGGHAIGFGHTAVLPLHSMLVEGIEDVPGPALGCEDSVAAVDAVDTVSDAMLNRADLAAGGNLMISGRSFGAADVTVTVGTVPAENETITGPADGPQTWTASVPMSAIADLPDGDLSVSLTATRGGESLPGVSKTVVKDVVAPAAPTVAPNGGAISGSRSVSIAGAAGDRLFYTVGNGSQAAPTVSPGGAVSGSQFSAAFSVSAGQTVKAIAVDAVDNVSGVATAAFTVAPPVVTPPVATPPVVTPPVTRPPGTGSAAIIPLAPAIAEAKSGKAGGADTATARWRLPLANGAVRDGYEVRALKLRPGKSAKIRPAVVVEPNAAKLKLTLPSGKYRFQVRATSAAGKSPWSQRSNTVTAR